MDFSNLKIIVTGGAGSNSANLANHLLKEGATVTIFDDFSVGSKWNLSEIVNHVTIVKDNVRDFSIVKRVIFGQDFVLHIAANASVPIYSENPKYDFERAHARVCRLLADVTKTEIGFRPKVDLRTGLAQIVELNKSSNLQERRDVSCE